jgi:hypothetical protein
VVGGVVGFIDLVVGCVGAQWDALKIYTVRFSGSLIMNLISDLSNSE